MHATVRAMQARVQGMRAMMRAMMRATQGIKTSIDPLRGSPIFHCFPTQYLVFMAIARSVQEPQPTVKCRTGDCI